MLRRFGYKWNFFSRFRGAVLLKSEFNRWTVFDGEVVMNNEISACVCTAHLIKYLAARPNSNGLHKTASK